VEDVDNELTAREKAVGDELPGAEGDGGRVVGLNRHCQLYPSIFLFIQSVCARKSFPPLVLRYWLSRPKSQSQIPSTSQDHIFNIGNSPF
jgi:hypothetical protein